VCVCACACVCVYVCERERVREKVREKDTRAFLGNVNRFVVVVTPFAGVAVVVAVAITEI